MVKSLHADKKRDIDDLKIRDEQENKFRFSEEDINKYSKKVKTSKIEEKDYIGQKTLEEELANLNAQVTDMQSINLFGVAVSTGIDETKVIDSKTQ